MLLVAIALHGCIGARSLDSPDAGRTVAYQPGLPNFDFEAVAALEGEEPGVDVFVSLPVASLVFARTDSAFVARYDLRTRVLDRRGRDALATRLSTDTVTVQTFEATRGFDRLVRRERLAVPPGEYVVEAVLEDLESGALAERRQAVAVPAPGPAPLLGRLRLEVRSDTGMVPVVALHVPSGPDTLRAIAALYDAPAGSRLQLRVLRLRADTTVAYPPHWLAPSRGSLRHLGIDVGSAEVVAAARQPVERATAREAAFAIPPLEEGVYRLVLTLEGPDNSVLAEVERALSVKGPAFPRLATLEELIDALAYLTYPRELEAIRSGATPQERRQLFDAFWGSLVDDRRVAQNLLRQYYERVEEANLLFTSHKAGWKTDRGMIYVLFGAPVYVEQTPDGEVWHYDYSGEPDGAFAFERVDRWDDRDPFPQYVLVRRPIYERAWSRTLARWRRGEVL